MTNLNEAVERLDAWLNSILGDVLIYPTDIRTVLDALSTAQAYEDVLQKLLSRARRERDAILAVIDRIDGEVKDFEQSDNDALSAIEHILSKATPADALQERDAEVWREAIRATTGMLDTQQIEWLTTEGNPYREEEA